MGVQVQYDSCCGRMLDAAAVCEKYVWLHVQVYYCGGIDETNTFTHDACFQYDPASDTWADPDTVPSMPQGRNHAAACTDGEKMYVFGGRIGYNDVLEGFDDTQVWALPSPLC